MEDEHLRGAGRRFGVCRLRGLAHPPVQRHRQLVADGVAHLVGDAVLLLEVLRGLQSRGGHDHVAVHREQVAELVEATVHAEHVDVRLVVFIGLLHDVAEGRGDLPGPQPHVQQVLLGLLRLDPLADEFRAVEAQKVEGRGTQDADGGHMGPRVDGGGTLQRGGFLGGHPGRQVQSQLLVRSVQSAFLQRFDEGHVREFRALVVVLHAVGLDGQGREAELLLAHAGEGFQVRAHDRRDRGPDQRDEVRVPDRFHGAADFVDGPFIATEDGIQVPDARRVHGALFVPPAGLVEATDVSRAAAGVQDDDDAAELVEHGHGAGLVRGKGA